MGERNREMEREREREKTGLQNKNCFDKRTAEPVWRVSEVV